MKFKLELEKSKIIVRAVAKNGNDSSTIKFVLDTGATITLIDKSIADIMRLECSISDMLLTAGGRRTKAHETTVPSMQILGKEVQNFRISVVELPLQMTIFADGLLGMDFLKQLKRLNIDFENRIIETE